MTPEELVKALSDFDYPKRDDVSEETDMVMKGGITSGIVYPLAVCEMAKTKRFRNLGGSSAGGIAAAMAAAAELGRDAGGFNELAKLPDGAGPRAGHAHRGPLLSLAGAGVPSTVKENRFHVGVLYGAG